MTDYVAHDNLTDRAAPAKGKRFVVCAYTVGKPGRTIIGRYITFDGAKMAAFKLNSGIK